MVKGDKVFTFQGESYTSYYQLEKVMNISRRTIQYRHEVKGIPIDEVPNFVAEPPEKRFGEKVYFPNALTNKESKTTENELEKIINYPKEPTLYVGEDEERYRVSKQKYIEWLENAPITLLKRELRLYEYDFKHANARENDKYFYATTQHDNEKRLIEKRIIIIKEVCEKRAY